MLDTFENLDLIKAEKCTPDDEMPIIKQNDWVISLGMFDLPGFKQTQCGFLWQVVEVLPKQRKYDYLKALVRCADTGEISKLSLSMLYLCPDLPSEKLIKEYKNFHNKWLNRP